LVDRREGASAQKTKALLDDLNVCVYLLDEKMLTNIKDQRSAYKDRITNH
jgi:hypothetical protein